MLVKTSKNFDLSNDLLIQRWGSGIKLVKPENAIHFGTQNLQSINDIFSLGINAFFVNKDNIILQMNEKTAETCGFNSAKSSIGKTVEVAASKETAAFEHIHNQEVISKGVFKIKDEIYNRLEDGLEFTCINFKFPWFNHKNQVIGLFGFAIVQSANDALIQKCSLKTSVSESLEQITSLGFLNSNDNDYTSKILPGTSVGQFYLTSRESEIVKYILIGKTSKDIARILNLSYRTVEFYIARMKDKLNVSTKSQLIEKILLFIK